MKTWRETLRMMAAAIAFAEEGEWDTADMMLNEADLDAVSATIGKLSRADQKARTRAYRT